VVTDWWVCTRVGSTRFACVGLAVAASMLVVVLLALVLSMSINVILWRVVRRRCARAHYGQ
jgi:hypothetical protein